MNHNLGVRTAGAVLLSGTMWFLSNGINHVWPLAWLAPLPLLIVLPELRVIPAAFVGFTASAIGAFSWLVAYGPLSVAFVFMAAVPYTVVALLWRAIARRARPAIAAIAYPALVVTGEFLLSRVSPHGTLGNLAYSQGNVPVVLQVVSVTGLWGVSFLVALFPSSLAMGWRQRHAARRARPLLLLGVVPVIAVVAFGAVRLIQPDAPDQIQIGLAANDGDTARRWEQGPSGGPLPVTRAFAESAAALASRGAQAVILPEKFAAIGPGDEEAAHSILSRTAREHRITIVAGWYLENASERRNVAVVFGPDGDVIFEYDKHHLIPGIEWGYRAGDKIGVFPVQTVTTGVAICKDLDFVALGRAYGEAGVAVLFVPAWDFVRDRWLHSRMAVIRGVEGGYAVARVATDGLLTVSDARGRIVAERASDESADVLLSTPVQVGRGGTLYSRTGDWFAWFCVGLATLCVLAATVKTGRSSVAGGTMPMLG
jgi:apolipoprotein N-acyltransferase